MYIFLLLILNPPQIMALFCFDSGSNSSPGMVVNCSENELCYSEFYSISTSNTKSKKVTEWYVDRFCVHKEQCLRRGIGAGRCVNVSNLDPVVQKTFRHKINQKHSANINKRLLQSEFCCCQRDFCNKLDVDQLKLRYNISGFANGAIKIKCLLSFEIAFLFVLLRIFIRNI